MPFGIGDRIIVTKDFAPNERYPKVGDRGVIVDFGVTGNPAVCFDEEFPAGHDLNGLCEVGHGWYIFNYEYEIKL